MSLEFIFLGFYFLGHTLTPFIKIPRVGSFSRGDYS